MKLSVKVSALVLAVLIVGYFGWSQFARDNTRSENGNPSSAAARPASEAKVSVLQPNGSEKSTREIDIPKTVAKDPGPVIVVPKLTIRQEFEQSRKLKQFFDKYLASLNSASGEAKFYMAEVLQHCSSYVGRSLSKLPRRPLIEEGEKKHPNFEERSAAVQRRTSECEGFETYEPPSEFVTTLMNDAAKQGFPAAQAAALVNMQIAGNTQEAYSLASTLIKGELDPYMLRGLLEYALRVGPALGDPPVIPKRDQYADAWQLAICDFGMDCSANSPILSQICIMSARCGAASYEEYVAKYRYSSAELPEVLRIRQLILLALQQRKLVALGIGR